MSNRLRISGAFLGVLFGSACDVHTGATAPVLSSFTVKAEDKSGALGNFPITPIVIHVTADAFDQNGNALSSFNGAPYVYVTPGQVMQNAYSIAATPAQQPTLCFNNGHADSEVNCPPGCTSKTPGCIVNADINAVHVFGATSIWVEDRADSTDGGGGYATGVSDPDLVYGYPLLADTQIDSTNTLDPLDNNYVVIDGSKSRCIAPPPAPYASALPAEAVLPDGGCAPAFTYNMDLLVTCVQSDGFYVMDRNAYYLDGGTMVPSPGWDPDTNAYDLPGTWSYMFVYNYDAPALFVGNHLTTVSGTVSEFDGDTQMGYPAWTLNPDPQYASPQPQDVPPPITIDPTWCTYGTPGDHLADQFLCAPGTDNLQMESLESGLVVARNVTMPDRWLNCDLTGTGKIPYRTATGCMPATSGSFCGEPGAAITQCPAGQDCVANECVAQCHTAADCSVQDQEACIDGHCQNACLCLEYCNSILGCSEQSGFTTYGQFSGWIPGEGGGDGGIPHTPWDLGFVTRNGAPALNPVTSPGMVLDIEGMMQQVRAADPMWEIVPRVDTDVCCHSGSPGCSVDAGVAVPICPQPTSQ